MGDPACAFRRIPLNRGRSDLPNRKQWETAESLILQYHDNAEAECDARASYHELQHDDLEAIKWRFTKQLIQRIRRGEKPPRA